MSNFTITKPVLCITRKRATFLLMSLSLVAVPLHFLVMRVLVVRFRLALPRHKILLFLSVSDSIQILGAGLIGVIGMGLQPAVTSLSCQVLRQTIEVVGMQTHSASSGFIVLLAIERYVACIHSLRFHTIVTSSRTSFAVVSVWVISILCGLLALHPNEPNYKKDMMYNGVPTLSVFTTTSLMSTFVLIVVQARLYRLSRTKLKVVPSNLFGNQKEKNDLMRRQLKLGFAASVVIITYIVCILPLTCLFIYILFNPKKDLFKVKGVAVFFAMLNTFVDPLVYGLGMADIRQGIRRDIKNLKQRFCSN